MDTGLLWGVCYTLNDLGVLIWALRNLQQCSIIQIAHYLLTHVVPACTVPISTVVCYARFNLLQERLFKLKFNDREEVIRHEETERKAIQVILKNQEPKVDFQVNKSNLDEICETGRVPNYKPPEKEKSDFQHEGELKATKKIPNEKCCCFLFQILGDLFFACIT